MVSQRRSSVGHLEALQEDLQASRLSLSQSQSSIGPESLLGSVVGLGSKPDERWRHTLGISLLLVTVFLWTASNFLASTIFADNTYSRPYFVTYINSSFFVIPLFPLLYKKWREDPREVRELLEIFTRRRSRRYAPLLQTEHDETDHEAEGGDSFVKPNSSRTDLLSSARANNATITNDTIDGELRADFHFPASNSPDPDDIIDNEPTAKLTLLQTFHLAIPFCFLWFFANYFSVACLEYTTVGSATILSSTSSIWTLLCGTLVGVERFTVKKLLGVMASLAGVMLISGIDIGGGDDADRGRFPHKTSREVAIGDALSLVSAFIYGVYAVVIKKRIGDESRVNMPLFFGLVGILNVLLMWPGFIILHVLGVEPFSLPPTSRVTLIIAVNSTSSLVSDYCWVFSMLLTSPLVVTVGLSLTIPLSLVGQMLLSGTYSGWLYWVGAAIVVGSFVFINNEESKDTEIQDMAAGVHRRSASIRRSVSNLT